jgi:cytochrome c biogenesis factor
MSSRQARKRCAAVAASIGLFCLFVCELLLLLLLSRWVYVVIALVVVLCIVGVIVAFALARRRQSTVRHVTRVRLNAQLSMLLFDFGLILFFFSFVVWFRSSLANRHRSIQSKRR